MKEKVTSKVDKQLFWLSLFLLSLLTLSAVIVFWKVDFFYFHRTTDKDRIASYGTFISGIVSAVTLVLVVYAYKASRHQIMLTRRQSFDATFFNYLQIHRDIITRIHDSRSQYVKSEYEKFLQILSDTWYNTFQYIENKSLRDKYLQLYQDAQEFNKNLGKHDVIDVLYNLLMKHYYHRLYNQKLHPSYEDSLSSYAGYFFSLHDYMFVNYINNFFSILQYVINSDVIQPQEKAFYINILEDSSTLNELRLIFYRIIGRADDDARAWKQIATSYNLFYFINDDYSQAHLINRDKDINAFRKL
jgi:hypothetical protein